MGGLNTLPVYTFCTTYVALAAGKAIKAHKREWCTLAQNGPGSLRQDFSELGGSELQHDFQDGKWEER